MANLCFSSINFEGAPENLHSMVEYLNSMFWVQPDNVMTCLLRLEEMVPTDESDYAQICGSRYFELLTFSTEYSDLSYDSIHSIPPYNSKITGVFIHGESANAPVLGLIAILCKKFELSAECSYECNEENLYGQASIDNTGIMGKHEYEFWRGIAELDPDDYLERASMEVEHFADEEEFRLSDIWIHCPEGLQDKLMSDFKGLEQEEYE